jgi:murein DD-endopeptidase MepM/ murein hydrolase activator NlpD
VLQRGRLGAFLCLAAAVWFSAYPLSYPSSHEGHPSAVRFRLPFEGEWTVRWGGTKGPESALVLQPDRRFGFDFVVCNAEGRTSDGADFYCRGRDVLAPAAGVVAAVHDGEPDAPRGALPAGAEPYGNHVVLQVAEGEFLFLIGLEQGSLRVAEGARVAAGDPLGRAGFSARSALTPEAHLGVHLQDTALPRRGEGIPFAFRDYVSGERPVESGVPLGGLRAGLHTGARVRPAGPR